MSITNTNGRILIIEDDADQVRLYSKVLRGFIITAVANGSRALEVISKELPDLVILDHVLDGGERGADLVHKIKEIAAHLPVIIISGTLKIEKQLEALSGPKSAHYVLEKPIRIKTLREVVNRALNECGLGETIEILRSLERSRQIENNEPERQFTTRLNRQYQLVLRLRGTSSKPNISSLSREFEVDRRTIQRDLSDLVERGQLPREVYPDSPTDGLRSTRTGRDS